MTEKKMVDFLDLNQTILMALPLKNSKAIELLEKLFKGKVIASQFCFKAGGPVSIYEAPNTIESGSIEEEVIFYYYKNSRIADRFIEIPFTSL